LATISRLNNTASQNSNISNAKGVLLPEDIRYGAGDFNKMYRKCRTAFNQWNNNRIMFNEGTISGISQT